MIADRTFDRDNQLTDPFTDLRPPADGVTGRSVLVNGAFMPHHRVAAAALPAADPQRLRVPRLQPLPLERDADDPDRHRQRPDAAAGQRQPGPDRPGRAGRADRRLRRALRRRDGRAAERPGAATPRPLEPLRRPADAVPRRLPRCTTAPGARAAAAAARVDQERDHGPDQTWTIVGGLFNPTG